MALFTKYEKLGIACLVSCASTTILSLNIDSDYSTMVLLHIGNGGQLGNNFISAIHLLANSINYGYDVRLYSLILYQDYLSPKNHEYIGLGSQLGKYPLMLSFTLKAINFYFSKIRFQCGIIQLLNDTYIQECKLPKSVNLASGSKVTVYSGWLFRDFQSLSRHKDLVRSLIKFQKLKPKINNGLFKIGVHVRRGDYCYWQNGRYFYEDSIYLRICRQMADYYKSLGYSLVFCPVSNELLDFPSDINGFPIDYSGTGTPEEDLLRLANCNTIIGPPSTFSRLSSFLGDTNIFCIERPDQNYDPQYEKPYA